MKIKLKRVYQEAEQSDGFRILTERLWPRGVSKERAQIDLWLKSVSPSPELRKWFNHDADKWEEFKERYRRELYGSEAVEELAGILHKEPVVTFVFASKNEQYNSSVLLKDFMENLLSA